MCRKYTLLSSCLCNSSYGSTVSNIHHLDPGLRLLDRGFGQENDGSLQTRTVSLPRVIYKRLSLVKWFFNLYELE